MIITLGILSIVLLVLGISFIFRGFLAVPSSSEDEWDDMQKDLSGAKEENTDLKKQLDRLAVELEDSKSKLDQVKTMEADWNDLKNKELNQGNKIRQLKHDLDFLYSRADTQADKAASVLENLYRSNEALQKELEEFKNKPADTSSVNEIKAENERLQGQIAETTTQFESLKQELQEYRDRAQEDKAQGQDSKGLLMEENERLKSGIKEIVSKIDQVQEAFSQVEQQKGQQLDQANDAVKTLHLRIEALTREKEQNSAKISKLEQLLEQKEKERIAQGPDTEMSRQGTPSAEDMKVHDELKRLKQMNDFMGEQEKLLELELTKYRARVVGLEAICKELRKQVHQDM